MVESEKVYPFLIFGVGLSETILNSAMATRKQPSVNIEFGKVWSGATKTLTIREIESLFKGTGKVLKREPLEAEGHHDPQQDVKLTFYEEGLNCTADFVKKYGFRDFNIDFNPKLIVVPSKAANHLIEAHVDEYLQFSSVNHLLHAEGLSGPTEPVPLGREGIFNNHTLNLAEKKELYNFLNIAVRLCRGDGEEEDVNSIDDFKKNLYVEISGVIKKLRTQKAEGDHQVESTLLEFFEATGLKTAKLVRLVAYCLCNYRINPLTYKPSDSQFEIQTMKDALSRLARFIESLMENGFKIPYKYTRYGSGDISQICTRIGSVYESFTMLEQQLQVLSASWETEVPVPPEVPNSEPKAEGMEEPKPLQVKHIKLETIHNGQPQTLRAQKLYLGPEYHPLGYQIQRLLEGSPEAQTQAPSSAPVPQQPEKVRWFTVVGKWVRPPAKDTEEDEEDAPAPQVYPFPVLMYIDLAEETEQKYSHPVQVLVLDHTSGVAANGCVLLNFSYYCEHTSAQDSSPKFLDEEMLLQSVSRRLSEMFPHMVQTIEPIFKIGFLQDYKIPDYQVLVGDKGPQAPGITLLPDADFELEMERVFSLAREEVLPDSSDKTAKLFLREPVPSPVYISADGTVTDQREEPDEEETEEDRILKELESFEL